MTEDELADAYQGLPELTEVQRVTLEPGDIIVARTKARQITEREADTIRQRLRRYFPANKVLILSADMELFVAREGA